MTKQVVSGGWYCDSTPDGHTVVLMKDRHLLHDGHVVELPPGNLNLLYVRLNETGMKFAGVGHQDDRAWEYFINDPNVHSPGWLAHGPAFGPNAVIYDVSNNLHIVSGPGTITGSQGWRYLADDGRLITCDETYADPTRQIWEYTTHGDITVGQGGDGPHGPDPCIVLIDGTRRLLESGTCRFIRFRMRTGDICSIGFVKEEVGAVLIWATRAELAALPLADISIPKPPEPPQPPNPPEPPMFEYLDIVKTVRGSYPTPLGNMHAAFLLDLAREIEHGAGLLRKDSGTNILLPDGTRVAQDIICFPDGIQYDCLFDGENKAIPIWGPVDRDDYTPDPSRYYAVQSVPDPPDPPTPDPEPHAHPEYITQIEELHTMLGAVLRRLDEHEAKFDGIAQLIEGMLTDKLARLTVEGTTASTWGHKHGFAGTVKPKQE